MTSSHEWPVTVQWGQLRLRPLTLRDRDEWDSVRYRNRDWLEPWEATSPVPQQDAPTFRQFVRSMQRQAKQGSALPWLIQERHSGSGRFRLVGQLTVSGIVRASSLSATLGYWVDGQQAGRGIAPMAVAMATDYCFQYAGLHRMEINIRPENTKSLRVVEKLGFREEGLRKDFLHIGGRWTDHRSFALTAPEIPDGLVSRFTHSAQRMDVYRGNVQRG